MAFQAFRGVACWERIAFWICFTVAFSGRSSASATAAEGNGGAAALAAAAAARPSPTAKGPASPTTGLCRSKDMLLEQPFFELHSCAWCFHYLARSNDIRALPNQPILLVVSNRTAFPVRTVLYPNVTDPEHVSKICSAVSQTTCDRWKECCHAGIDCCRRQLAARPTPNDTCARTWDGWSCWDDQKSGTVEYVRCPNFLQYAVMSSYGKKTCLENATWFTRYTPGRNGSQGRWVEWTDYTTCVDKQRLVTSVYLAVSCNSFSVLSLLPAIAVFLAYRALRRQHRIRLHINFFTALLLSNIMSILWDVIVTHDRLTNDSANTTPVLLGHGTGCKLLSFLRLYFKSTTYVWMFCEGFYLHRLISNAFTPPKSLVFLYASGWGVPLGYCVLYIILKAVYANHSCWAYSFGHLEWIVYVPNLLSLVVNLFFLCNILRVLLTQLQTHPNEPNNFRRALKATFVLIPLFGVQLFVTIYRLPAGQAGASEYEMFTVIVTNSQGFFVALIFCYFNGEVIAQMKRTCTRLNLLRPAAESGSRGNTLATVVHHRDEDSEYQAKTGLLQHGWTQASTNRNAAFDQPSDGVGNGTTVNAALSGGNQNHDKGGRDYTYIPMKTLVSDGSAPGDGLVAV